VPYSTFAVSKWSCYRGENDSLPIMERKNPLKSLFVVNGLKTFNYEEIKMRGVESCIDDIKRLIKAGQFGKIYRDTFHDIDEQYFNEADYGLLSSYFDQFMKDVFLILHPSKKEKVMVFATATAKKSALQQKQVDLNKQIQELQAEVKKSKQEAEGIDLDALKAEIDETE